MVTELFVASALIALASMLLSPRVKTASSFYHGTSQSGQQPGLLTLTLSQVTTWIFARSLMNAAILGFYYGLWGTLAYAAYYLSFLTGAAIIDSLRFRHGYRNIQGFLHDRFGSTGTSCYNFVIGLRLVSEVFANVLVIGILFGASGSDLYTFSIIGFAVVTLLYSMSGGLHASLRTDVMQMFIFIIVLSVLLMTMIFGEQFSWDVVGFKAFDIQQPGPILLLVALLQVWSYPMHDPVMMDRGFLADRATTRRSFYHAAWISILCILSFGLLGIYAGANTMSGENMNATLTRLLGDTPMLLFSITLIISAMSTLDSTLSSSAKLIVIDMKLLPPSIFNGRVIMALFMLLGLLLAFSGNRDLFSAVAVSGTASMYLAPVIFFSLWAGRNDIPVWSYSASFILAVGGAVLYFLESSAHTAWLGESHKYTKLLWISLAVMLGGCLLFWLGGKTAPQQNPVNGNVASS
jgi:Na+/proline symporter